MKGDGMERHSWSPRVWAVMGLAILALVLVPMLGTRTVAQPTNRPDFNGNRYLFSDLAERVLPSVVTVYVKRDLRKELDPRQLERLKQFQERMQDPLLKQMIPGMPTPDESEGDEGDQWITKGSGSGVIVSPDGYIVTNWHVVGDKKNKPELRVVLSDNTELSGKDVQVIESSQLADMAVIKINRTGLQSVKWGDSNKLRIGEWVAAIGSPLDLRLSVTQGIVCAMHREIDSGAGMGSMIQTDAVINPGSSGGALVNLDGELIGINRLITTPFQGREAWSGYGFAIPANDARRFVEQVIKYGSVIYGYIGVNVANEFQDSAKMREALGLDKDQKGALVFGVTPGSPAAEAGLQEGDLVIQADKEAITGYNALVSYIANREVGSTVRLMLIRPQENGKPKRVELSVKVAKRPTQEELDKLMSGQTPAAPTPKPQVMNQNRLGVDVEPYNQGGASGLKITKVTPGSAAERAGLQPGDIVTRINEIPVRTDADINQALRGRTDRPHLIRYLREGRAGMAVIDMPRESNGKGGGRGGRAKRQ